MIQKFTLTTACILGAIGVVIGAFGAHALKPMLEASGRIDTFETGVKYHFVHALLMLAIGILMTHIKHPLLNYASIFAVFGVFLFSGSIYAICLTGYSKLGMITPFGGLLFIASWITTAIAILKS